MGKVHGLAGQNMLTALRDTFFKAAPGEPPLTDGELMAACAICKRYDLDPFLREVHCTRAKGRLLIMVGIDGWQKQALRHPAYDGMDAPVYEEDAEGKTVACTVTLYRKDQGRPTSFTAWRSEWEKGSGNWQVQPRHMLFIKALKGAIRLCFGISGLDMEDPGEISEMPIQAAPTLRQLPQPVVPEEDNPFLNPPPSYQELAQREPGQEG